MLLQGDAIELRGYGAISSTGATTELVQADAMEIVSAERVLVTTFWIFLLPHISGLIGHSTFLAIFWCVPTIMQPA